MKNELESLKNICNELCASLELGKGLYISLERDLNRAKIDFECHRSGPLDSTQES